MVDLFFPDAAKPDGFRVESRRVVAYDDNEAIREARLAAIGNPAHFHVRKVSRSGEKVIYRSENT
jgi:hypothetical protein